MLRAAANTLILRENCQTLSIDRAQCYSQTGDWSLTMYRDEETKAWVELMELFRRQLDSLENQVYIKATDQELQEFDQRESRIRELQEELDSVKRAA